MDWKIYYGDGSTYNSDQSSPQFVPKRDVQVILVKSANVGRRAERDTDYYIWTVDGWRGVDIFGMYDYLIEPGKKIVLFGRLMNNQEYKELLNRALLDPDFPRKTGKEKSER